MLRHLASACGPTCSFRFINTFCGRSVLHSSGARKSNSLQFSDIQHRLDWARFNVSTNTVYRLSGRQFYRSKDPTNSIKVLKEKLASHSMEEAQNQPGDCHNVTSEPLQKRKTLSQWVKPSKTKPHTAGWPVQVLYRTIDCATIDATQHFSKTGLGILYPLCTKPTSMMKCG